MTTAPTYLVELTDDARTGKVVLPLLRPEVQRPAVAFVFDVLGNADTARLKSDRHLSDSDLALLAHLRDVVFTRDGAELVIRDGVSFEANREVLDPDAPLEEYFLPRRRADGEVYVCQIEVISHDPERAKKRQMLAYQIMFMLHRFQRGYEIRADEVDRLRDQTEEAERRGLLAFDMAKSTFVVTPDGDRAHESLGAEAQELLRRYDIYADVDADSRGDIRFGTGQGQDLRVPIYELVGSNPFRARFVLGLSDGEWDALADWPACITSPQWFDEIFAYIEQCPTIDDIGRERLEAICDAGKRELRGDTGPDEDDDPRYAEPGYYHDPFFANSWWWLLFLL
jgi:hypothetical protein